jgi:acyl-CoA thioester hydrolase
MITYRGSVYPAQCDQMGHMNVSFYVAKFDEATWQLFAAIGLTRTRLRDDGLAMAGVEQDIDYKRELFAGDVVTVTVARSRSQGQGDPLRARDENDATGDVCAKTALVAVHLDAAARKARPFPDDVRDRARAMIEGERAPLP